MFFYKWLIWFTFDCYQSRTDSFIAISKLKLSGDQDIRDATIDKAHYLAQIGDKDEAIKVFGSGNFQLTLVLLSAGCFRMDVFSW